LLPAVLEPEQKGPAPRTLLQAAGVNLLNPNPYLGWSLVLGPAFLDALHQGPANAVVLLVAFYATMVMMLAGTILLFGTTSFLGPRGRHTLILVSAITLGMLGAYRLITGLL
jgi:threonine/homoserine/homoserine lactone efflux protein